MKPSDKLVKTSAYVGGILAVACALLLVILIVLAEFGCIHPRKMRLGVELSSISKVYDGTELSGSVKITHGKLANGHRIEVISQSSITKVGTVKNEAEFVILDDTGADVTELYNIYVEQGDLTITKRKISLTCPSDSKAYDGKPLTANSFTTKEQNKLAVGDRIEYLSWASLSEIGEIKNDIEFVILSANGENVTDQYEISKKTGTLRVSRRPLSIESQSKRKTYDGKPLECAEFRILSGSLLSGHSFHVQKSTKLTAAGSVPNKLECVVLDEKGNDVTHCYNLSQNTGTLSISPIMLSVSTGSAKKFYDGTPLECRDYRLVSGTPLSGHKLVLKKATVLMNTGTVDNNLEFMVVDSTGADVTEGYAIVNTAVGTLTVEGRFLSISTGSSSKEYDGTPLSNSNWALLNGNLAAGHTLVIAEQTKFEGVGSVDNVIRMAVLDKNGADVTKIYDIDYAYGTLSVQPRKISIAMGSVSKVYDGTPLSCHRYTLISGSLCSGHVLSVVGKERTDVGRTYNDLTSFSIKVTLPNGTQKDVSDCYQLSYTSGTITVKAP